MPRSLIAPSGPARPAAAGAFGVFGILGTAVMILDGLMAIAFNQAVSDGTAPGTAELEAIAGCGFVAAATRSLPALVSVGMHSITAKAKTLAPKRLRDSAMFSRAAAAAYRG